MHDGLLLLFCLSVPHTISSLDLSCSLFFLTALHERPTLSEKEGMAM
jgi:hypothetical protein